jgi:2-polyprenyl-6-methoxyphenol hydroxylase-like FAD-dependent oxidoreductase
MGAEVTGLLREDGRVVGVRYRDADGSDGELRAAVSVACDGRTSAVRAASGLRVREFGVPLDVCWFRLPRHEGDSDGLEVRLGDGAILIVVDRGSYFQMAYEIRKGGYARLREDGIEAFRRRIAALAPELADRIGTVDSWDDVKLLAVRLDRMPRWFSPGLLCIGDAAHAMSPVAGVGINLAIQDAVAAARYLAPPLRDGEVRLGDLARVQAHRWAPTFVTQSLQQLAHRFLIQPALDRRRDQSARSRRSRLAPLLLRSRRVRAIPAYLVAIGVLPEHAPSFAVRRAAAARRAPTPPAARTDAAPPRRSARR